MKDLKGLTEVQIKLLLEALGAVSVPMEIGDEAKDLLEKVKELQD